MDNGFHSMRKLTEVVTKKEDLAKVNFISVRCFGLKSSYYNKKKYKHTYPVTTRGY